jgi:hypothetical protein
MDTLFIGIGIVFGILAGLVAFLITLNEWSHHYQTRREPIALALRAGLFAFAVFFLISAALGFAMPFVLR